MADFFGKLKGTLENLGKTISEKADVVSKKTGEVVDVVSKKTGEVVDVVTKKTEQTVEVQKLKSQIHLMERNNDRDYKDIGKMIYDRFKKGEEVDTAFTELCEAIAERDNTIAEAKQEIAKLKGLDVCPNCAAHVEQDVKFCPKCGAKIDEEEVGEAEFEEDE